MGLALGKGGAVYVVTRSDVYLLRDTDGDGVADERRVIVRLDSPATYPHNGLSGFAFDGLGNLYFGLGENLGAKYKLIGSDGTTLSGGGEGGSIYRCRPDGSGLVRIATGFWNPFHLTFDAFGRLFAVDNDPDSRGPADFCTSCRAAITATATATGAKGCTRSRRGTASCRARSRWWQGRGKRLAAWWRTRQRACRRNTGAACWSPHGATTWSSDSCLAPRGASFASQSQTVIQGGEDFRPVGITTAPDGSLYLSDWVDKSYPVHGKGRIWRIRWKSAPPDDGLRPSQVGGRDNGQLRLLLADARRPIRDAAGDAIALRGEKGKEILAGVLTDRKRPPPSSPGAVGGRKARAKSGRAEAAYCRSERSRTRGAG